MMKNIKKFFGAKNILFVGQNIALLSMVMTMVITILEPSTKVEWLAIVLVGYLTMGPIANMTRKDMKDDIQIEKVAQERHERKIAS